MNTQLRLPLSTAPHLTADVIQQYQRLRSQGWTASEALGTARDLVDWQWGEYFELVKLEMHPDYDVDLSWLDQDCFTAHDKRRTLDQVERDGAWGIVGYRRLRTDEPWTVCDSIWGILGDPWSDDNEYARTDVIHQVLRTTL